MSVITLRLVVYSVRYIYVMKQKLKGLLLKKTPVRLKTLLKNIRFVKFRMNRKLALAGGGVALVAVMLYTVNLYWPRTMAFSYSTANCSTNPVLLPNLLTPQQSPSFSATLTKSVSLAKYPLYSHRTCITPTKAPKEKTSEFITLSAWGNGLVKKRIRITPNSLPKLGRQAAPEAPVATNQPLAFTLDTAD
jgi:hypothetical protein